MEYKDITVDLYECSVDFTKINSIRIRKKIMFKTQYFP